jgi:hypothetical protein
MDARDPFRERVRLGVRHLLGVRHRVALTAAGKSGDRHDTKAV